MSQTIKYDRDTGHPAYFIDDKSVTADEFFGGSQDERAKRLADMLTSGKAPYGISDDTFLRGNCNGKQFEGMEATGDHYKKVCEDAGGQTKGRKYLSGLARYPGDPEAWVGSRGDVQRICEKRGWGCDGTVTVKPRESLNPPTPGPEVAADLLDNYTNMIANNDPRPDLVDRDDLKEQVRERIKPKHWKKPLAKKKVNRG